MNAAAALLPGALALTMFLSPTHASPLFGERPRGPLREVERYASDAGPRQAGEPAAIEIVRVPKPGLGVVQFRVLVLSGSADDPKGKEGLAAFTGELLRRGTRSMVREQIDDALDQIAASIGVQVQKELTVIHGVTLLRNLEEFYRIFSEMLRAPRFDASEIEKLKTDQIDAVESVRQSDEGLAREVFFQELYAGHPYGHLDSGTLSAIRSFTLEDAQRFYRTHYVRGNVIGGLAGDVDEALAARLRSDLEALPEGRVEHPARPKIKLRGRRAVLIEKEGRTQTHLRAGHPIEVTRAHPDYAALRLANSYLGQHRSTLGRLFQSVREQRGLSYGAYSYIEYFLGAGGPIKLSLPNLARREQAINFWIYPRSENAAFVLKLGVREMDIVARQGIPDGEFEAARAFLRNSFPFEIETPARELAMALDDRIYGSRDIARRFPEEVARLTPEQVRKVAKRHIRPADLLVVAVVPDAEAFRQQLLSGDAPLIYPSGVDPASLEKDDAAVRALPLGFTPDAIKILKAADLFR